MLRGKPLIVILGVCGLLAALLAACPNPVAPGKGSSLIVSINNNINTRTLLPAIDMIAASFTVSGTGPGGATFPQTTSGAPVTVDGLAFGPGA
jgi:H+/Cl- antiporter ClcA